MRIKNVTLNHLYPSLMNMICHEEEPEFLLCNLNLEDCSKKWHEMIKTKECPYCRSFTIFNEKFNLFLRNIKDSHESIDVFFGEGDIEHIFLYLTKYKVNEKIFQYLVPAIKSESKKVRLLLFASEKGYFVAVQLLLNYKLAKTYLGNTALIIASQNGHLEIVKLLLEHGAQVVDSNNLGKTAMMFASETGHLEIVKLFLNYGAPVDSRDNNGKTALMFASEKGHLEILKLLLDHGAEVEAKDDDGCSALMRASMRRNLITVKLLLDHSAEVEAKDAIGMTALMFASCRCFETTKLLLDHGAQVDSKDDEGCI